MADLRTTKVGHESATIAWTCFPGIEPNTYHDDGAYLFAEKGGEWGSDWTTGVKVFSGTTVSLNLRAGNEYSVRVAPYINGQPGPWEELTFTTTPY